MNTRNLYPLIGDKTERLNWLVTSSLRPDLAFSSHGQNTFLSASHFPLLKPDHIPLKWLKADPGFPLLLIEPADLKQDWIYHPYDQTQNHFQLRQKSPSEKPQKILVVLEEHATREDVDFFKRNLSGDKQFIYRDRENFQLMKELQILSSYLFCFQSAWIPELIYFQEPGMSKCLRPHILHAIHLGGVIKTGYWNKTPTIEQKLWYGTWELFHV